MESSEHKGGTKKGNKNKNQSAYTVTEQPRGRGVRKVYQGCAHYLMVRRVFSQYFTYFFNYTYEC